MLALGDLLRGLLSGRGSAAADIDIDLGRFDEDEDEEEDPADRREPAVGAREGMWRESSFELQRGLEVSEEPMDSMPAELIDVFCKR